MAHDEMTTLSQLEDRIFDLELTLLNIGGALLAPSGWEDDQQLHQHLYATAKRALRGSPLADALGRREQQLQARERSAPAVEKVMVDLHSELSDSAERQARL